MKTNTNMLAKLVKRPRVVGIVPDKSFEPIWLWNRKNEVETAGCYLQTVLEVSEVRQWSPE